jgi:hypothetical protein
MKFKLDFKQLFGKATDAFFGMGLTGTGTFHGVVRPILHGHSEGNIAKAQSLALEGMRAHLPVVLRHSEKFLERFSTTVSYETVRVRMAGKTVIPVGTGPGLDPNAEGLEPLAHLFGFQVPGPVSLEPRDPDEMPFVDDPQKDDLYVPPFFASAGLEGFLASVKRFREGGGRGILLPSVVGLPSEVEGLEAVFRELETIVAALAPHVDGFVWSPLLTRSARLIFPSEFRRAGGVLAALAGERLKLVEMPPYEEAGREAWLDLVGAFIEGGGDGLLAVSGLEVDRSSVPPGRPWPYETALLWGRSLAPYRQRAIEDARRRFPRAFIAACGGLHDPAESFQAFEHADVIMENEAFTRYGPGLSPLILNKLVLRLNALQRRGESASNRLADYQKARWGGG